MRSSSSVTAPLSEKIALDIGLPATRPTVRLDEVAKALGISAGAVRNLIDEGILITSSKTAAHTGDRQRRHLTIERWSVEAWRLNQWQDQGVPTEHFQQSDMVLLWRRRLREIEKLQGGKH